MIQMTIFYVLPSNRGSAKIASDAKLQQAINQNMQSAFSLYFIRFNDIKYHKNL